MAINSRDFTARVTTINTTTEMICDFLRSRTSVITRIFYPKYDETTSNYLTCTRSTHSNPGYGGLFSILFVSDSAAQTFFNHLKCEKGPTFGTVFTLACPYAILAHYGELDWAEKHGVPPRLVRVGVGLEKAGGAPRCFGRLSVLSRILPNGGIDRLIKNRFSNIESVGMRFGTRTLIECLIFHVIMIEIDYVFLRDDHAGCDVSL